MKTINCNNGWYLGLGDLVCFAWLASGARAEGEEVRLFATGWRAEVLRLLGIEPTDDPEGSIISEGGFEDARAAGEEISYLEAMRREFGIASAPRRPLVDLGTEEKSFHLHERTVLLFPHTNGPSRQWPAAYWIDLAHLLQERGLHPAIVLQQPDPRFEGRVPCWIAQLSYRELFAQIAEAELVIGSDSGPAHVAGTLGIRTLVLAGPTGSPTFSHLPEVSVLHREQPACSGCYYRGDAYRRACEVGCGELFELNPYRAFGAALRLLGPTKLRDSQSPIPNHPSPRRKKQ